MPKQKSGYFRFFLAQGDLEAYAGYGVERHEDWVAEYTPYWYEAGERDKYEAVFSFQIAAKNTDSAGCPEEKEPFTVTGADLPAGWRLDEGGCQNVAAPQERTDVCFTVAVAAGAAKGPHEILVRIERADHVKASEWIPLWLCVGGYNSIFQTFKHNRVPPWECVVDGHPDLPKTPSGKAPVNPPPGPPPPPPPPSSPPAEEIVVRPPAAPPSPTEEPVEPEKP